MVSSTFGLHNVSGALLNLLLQHSYGIDVDFGAHAGVQPVSDVVKYTVINAFTHIGDGDRSQLGDSRV